MDEGLARIRHERSMKDFPFLELEDNEYVEYAFRRAKIWLHLILGGLAAGLIFILLAFLLVLLGQDTLDGIGISFLYIMLGAMVAAVFLAAIFTMMVYRGNRLFITNRHVIQMVMLSPLSSSFNMIDLSSIEDTSFSQDGIWQKMFGYGTFRLSTVGDETTYTFKKSDITTEELKAISKLVSKAKNPDEKDNVFIVS
ncbi:PH domain-containing protein [Candidatus Saccharibacteria bacterium]|nr:PH domain-containing protein [Candidatus Saccharibacteria bacterium]